MTSVLAGTAALRTRRLSAVTAGLNHSAGTVAQRALYLSAAAASAASFMVCHPNPSSAVYALRSTDMVAQSRQRQPDFFFQSQFSVTGQSHDRPGGLGAAVTQRGQGGHDIVVHGPAFAGRRR